MTDWNSKCHLPKIFYCHFREIIFYILILDIFSLFLMSFFNKSYLQFKPVLSGHSKIDKTKVLKTKYHLMQVKSIAECSPWSILQYFWPALCNNQAWKLIFGLLLSGLLRQVLLYLPIWKILSSVTANNYYYQWPQFDQSALCTQWVKDSKLSSWEHQFERLWSECLFVLFVWFDSLCPINNLSVIKGRVFLGWTSTKLGLMLIRMSWCLGCTESIHDVQIHLVFSCWC